MLVQQARVACWSFASWCKSCGKICVDTGKVVIFAQRILIFDRFEPFHDFCKSLLSHESTNNCSKILEVVYMQFLANSCRAFLFLLNIWFVASILHTLDWDSFTVDLWWLLPMSSYHWECFLSENLYPINWCWVPWSIHPSGTDIMAYFLFLQWLWVFTFLILNYGHSNQLEKSNFLWISRDTNPISAFH